MFRETIMSVWSGCISEFEKEMFGIANSTVRNVAAYRQAAIAALSDLLKEPVLPTISYDFLDLRFVDRCGLA
jgi:hypothetical protein